MGENTWPSIARKMTTVRTLVKDTEKPGAVAPTFRYGKEAVLAENEHPFEGYGKRLRSVAKSRLSDPNLKGPP
jgi:hypothetical protein